MRVRFLQAESGDNGTIKWKYRLGEVVDVDKLPSGEASAYRWLDMNVVEFVEEKRASPASSGSASPSGETAPDDSVTPSDPPRRRGRPPKNQQTEAVA